MGLTAIDQARTDEADLVYAWRVEQLEKMRDRLGRSFTPMQVHELAGQSCDLHVARAWLADGCKISTAYKILHE
jgi:hypothetical protein